MIDLVSHIPNYYPKPIDPEKKILKEQKRKKRKRERQARAASRRR